eukprot:COSAG05_NODE_450_length_9731_cov_41.140201_4_plen_149_part_00
MHSSCVLVGLSLHAVGFVTVPEMEGMGLININRGRKSDGATALIIAAQEGHLEVVSDLVRVAHTAGSEQGGGLDLNRRNREGATALFMAAQEGHRQVVKLLLNLCGSGSSSGGTCSSGGGRVDVNLGRGDGATPLCIAAFAGHHRVSS